MFHVLVPAGATVISLINSMDQITFILKGFMKELKFQNYELIDSADLCLAKVT